MEANPQDVIDLAAGFKEAYGISGYLGLAVFGLKAIVEIWSKWTWIQGLLPVRLRWESLGVWEKRAVVGLVSLLGAILTSLVGGMSIQAALISALPVAIGAIGLHSPAKKLGSVIDAKAQAKAESREGQPDGTGDGKLRPDDMWEATKFRKLMSPVIPIDWSMYPKSAHVLGLAQDAVDNAKPN